jgi:hypothetical protein
MQTTTNRDKIIALLRSFIKQRPGMDPRNYGDIASYRAESRGITQDRHDAEQLLRQVELMEQSIPEAALRAAFKDAFGGRLSLTDTPKGLRLDYCTGQYFPTEYRRAVCAVLSSALWQAKRESIADVGELMHNSETGETIRRINGMRHGDYMRAQFKREFGQRIARRYFD